MLAAELDLHFSPSPLTEEAAISRGRVLLALKTREDAQQAFELSIKIHQHALAISSAWRVVLAMIVQALALDALGDDLGALETLKNAIEMAQPGGSLRTFADFGPTLCQLLSRLAASGLVTQPGAKKFVDRVLATFPEAPSASPVGNPPMLRDDLVEPLTRREVEVLELLAMGLSNKKIADTLVISPFTVRRHVENVSDKLGVRGRFAVVERARHLGLIAPSST